MIVWASGDGGHAATAGLECQVDRDRQGQRHWKKQPQQLLPSP